MILGGQLTTPTTSSAFIFGVLTVSLASAPSHQVKTSGLGPQIDKNKSLSVKVFFSLIKWPVKIEATLWAKLAFRPQIPKLRQHFYCGIIDFHFLKLKT